MSQTGADYMLLETDSWNKEYCLKGTGSQRSMIET